MDAFEKDRIASIVHRDCSLISGSTFYNAAHLAIEAMEARSKRLNEAAPELLEALRIADRFCGSLTSDVCPDDVHIPIRAAIQKALGAQS